MKKLLLALALLLSLPAASANATNCGTGGAGSTCFVVAAGGNSNATSTWTETSGGATCTCTPATSSTIILDSAAGGLNVNASMAVAALDATGPVGAGGNGSGYAATLTISSSTTLTINSNDAGSASGTTFKYPTSGAAYAFGNVGSSILTFTSTSGTSTVDFGGPTNWSQLTFNGAGGTFVLARSVTTSTNQGQMTLTNGHLDGATNSVNVTVGIFDSNNSNTRTLDLGSGTWKVVNTGTATGWIVNATTGMTLNAGTSTVELANVYFNGQANAGLTAGTYNNVTFDALSGGGQRGWLGATTVAGTLTMVPGNYSLGNAVTSHIGTLAATGSGLINFTSANANNHTIDLTTVSLGAGIYVSFMRATFSTHVPTFNNCFDQGGNSSTPSTWVCNAPAGGGGGGNNWVGGG